MEEAEVDFRAISKRLADGTYVVSVIGELDLHTSPELEQVLELNGGTGTRVVVDLSECTFIDSAALGILVKATRLVGPSTLPIVANSYAIVRALQVIGLDRHFALHPTVDSALNGGER